MGTQYIRAQPSLMVSLCCFVWEITCFGEGMNLAIAN